MTTHPTLSGQPDSLPPLAFRHGPGDLVPIFAAFIAAQSSGILVVAKNTNTQLNSKYADLADVLTEITPVLALNHLGMIQSIGDITRGEAGQNDYVRVTTIIIHISGQWLEFSGQFPMGPVPVSRAGNQILNPSQVHGIVTAYARRYAILTVLAIPTGDDKDAQRLNAAMTAIADETLLPPTNFTEAPLPEWFRLFDSDKWREAPDPTNPDKTLGDLSGEALRKVRQAYYRTNPSVQASMWNEIDDGLNAYNWDYSYASGKEFPAGNWPAHPSELTPRELGVLLAWVQQLPTP